MILKRTSNAGIMLALDGVKILFDGVSREGTAYPATSAQEQDGLIQERPDALCFSHMHPDHYDKNFALRYKNEIAGQIIGSADQELEPVTMPVQIDSIKVTTVESRHIGKVGINVNHYSFVVEGSSCVWVMGDAAVLQWKNRCDLPKPDVLIVPFAYATTATSWEITKSLGAKDIIIVHMPYKDNDPYSLWNAVENTVQAEDNFNVWIPKIGDCKRFYE